MKSSEFYNFQKQDCLSRIRQIESALDLIIIDHISLVFKQN